MATKSAELTTIERARRLLDREMAAQCRNRNAMARRLGIPESTLRAKLAGTRPLDLATARLLATELGIPASIVAEWETPDLVTA